MGKKRYAKRKARQVYMKLDKAILGLLDLKEMFDEDHPTYGEYLEAMAKLCLLCQQQVEDFYARAWGSPPSDWWMDSPADGPEDV